MSAVTSPSDKGGFNYQLVYKNPSDSLVCNICHLLSREPFLSECCGHTFCKSCLEDARESRTPTMACPMCHQEDFVTFRNKQVERAVKSVRVFCTNKTKGCHWQGEMSIITIHLGQSCQYVEEKCTNNCGMSLQRRLLARHLREQCKCRVVSCQYCKTVNKYQIIQGKHREECPKCPMPCPNKCGSSPVREDAEKHAAICPLEVVSCKYQEFGCEVKMARQDLGKHNNEKTDEHLSYVISAQQKAISNLTQRLLETENTLTATKKELKDTQEDLTGAKQLLSMTQEDLKQQLSLFRQDLTKVDFTLVANSDQALNMQSTLQEKITEAKTTTNERIDKVVSTLQKGINELEYRRQEKTLLIERNLWPTYMKKEAAILTTGDQIVPVIVKMSDYHKKRKDQIGWYCDPFYTHHKGYKMCLSIDVAGFGDGSGTHLSAGLLLMKGPNDDQLRWPLKGKCKVKLLNQTTDGEHHSVSGSYSDIGYRVIQKGMKSSYPVWSSSHLISNDRLQKVTSTCQYLKDDCIFFHVDYKA